MGKLFEELKANKEVITVLVRAGVVDSIWLRNIEMYEFFQSINAGRMERYSRTADKFRISEDRVRKCIKEMEG